MENLHYMSDIERKTWRERQTQRDRTKASHVTSSAGFSPALRRPNVAATASHVSVHASPFGYALSSDSLPLFNYTQAPTLFAITPSIGHAGSEVDIEMSMADGATGLPTVMLGGAACGNVVTQRTTYTSFAAMSMHITCNVSDAPPGSGPVAVTIPGVGLAAGNLTFTMEPAITAISPADGSAGGGTLLTLYGVGFDYLGEPVQAKGSGGWLGDGTVCLNPSPETGACAATSAQIGCAPLRSTPSLPRHCCSTRSASRCSAFFCCSSASRSLRRCICSSAREIR